MTIQFSGLITETVLVFAALFPIVNPLASAPLFLSMTPELTQESRRAMARRVATNSFGLLLGSLLVGSYVLKFFGISTPVVQVAGGLVVMASGWRLLNQPESARASDKAHAASGAMTRAFYPLTMPLTVGPGSISVAVTLGANRAAEFWSSERVFVQLIASVIAAALLSLAVYLAYATTTQLKALLRDTGTSVVVRLSAFILLCIGVQIVWNGAKALLLPVLRP